jgi:hypothetical protein
MFRSLVIITVSAMTEGRGGWGRWRRGAIEVVRREVVDDLVEMRCDEDVEAPDVEPL